MAARAYVLCVLTFHCMCHLRTRASCVLPAEVLRGSKIRSETVARCSIQRAPLDYLAWLAREKRGAIFTQRNTFDIDSVEASQACAIQDLVRTSFLS